MIIIFSTRDHWLSNAMRKELKESVSHCAILIDDIVIHSNWRGVHAQSLESYRDENEIVHAIELHIPANLQEILDKYGHCGYDVGAYAYLAANLVARKCYIPMPKVNLWQTTGMYLCTEFVTDVIDSGGEDSMITPYKLYKKLRETI